MDEKDEEAQTIDINTATNSVSDQSYPSQSAPQSNTEENMQNLTLLQDILRVRSEIVASHAVENRIDDHENENDIDDDIDDTTDEMSDQEFARRQAQFFASRSFNQPRNNLNLRMRYPIGISNSNHVSVNTNRESEIMNSSINSASSDNIANINDNNNSRHHNLSELTRLQQSLSNMNALQIASSSFDSNSNSINNNMNNNTSRADGSNTHNATNDNEPQRIDTDANNAQLYAAVNTMEFENQDVNVHESDSKDGGEVVENIE